MAEVQLHNHQTLRFVKELREKTVGTVEEKESVLEACRLNPSIFLMAAGWTSVIKEVQDDGLERPAEYSTQPFIPWEEQRNVLGRLVKCVEEGRDVAWAKSRDIGATWITLGGLCLWGWLFREWSSLLCSRTEDLVERRGDLDSLFPRLDVMINKMPSYFLPCDRALIQLGGKHRHHLILEHPNGHSIAGQATTAHIGRGGRRHIVVFDEAAAQEKMEAGWRSATDTAVSKLALSTHLQGSFFSRDLWLQALDKNTTIEAILTTYETHPTKSRKGVMRTDHDGSVTGDAGREYLHTPWLEEQLGRRDLVDMRENVFALPSTAGKGFFPLAHIVRLRGAVFSPRRCNVINGKLVDSPAGLWRIFREPDQHSKLVVAADPSPGKGMANTVAHMMDVDRMSVVAVFVDPNCDPYDLARELVMAGRTWAKGRADMLIGWETNGPGASFDKDLIRLRYNAIWRVGKKYGWTSNKIEKRRLFGDLARAMADNTIIVPDEETLKELEDTIVYDTGSIGPAKLEVDSTSGAREAHGDRVVSLALAYKMICDAVGGNDRPIPDPGIPSQKARDILNMNSELPAGT